MLTICQNWPDHYISEENLVFVRFVLPNQSLYKILRTVFVLDLWENPPIKGPFCIQYHQTDWPVLSNGRHPWTFCQVLMSHFSFPLSFFFLQSINGKPDSPTWKKSPSGVSYIPIPAKQDLLLIHKQLVVQHSNNVNSFVHCDHMTLTFHYLENFAVTLFD